MQTNRVEPLDYTPTIRMSDIYTQMYLSNIINGLMELMPIWRDNLDITQRAYLGYAYYARSARKIISPVMFDITNGGSEPLPRYSVRQDVTRDDVAKIVYTIFSDKWVRLWDAMHLSYNPISNYDMTETETIERSNDTETSDTRNITRTNDETLTDSSTTSNSGTVTDSGNNNVLDKIYGFNSVIGSEAQESNTLDSNTRTNNLSETLQGTHTRDNDETERHTNTGTINDDMNESRTLTRSGNIGVTTSQQMLESELELRRTKYFDIVFADIDSFCCIDVY